MTWLVVSEVFITWSSECEEGSSRASRPSGGAMPTTWNDLMLNNLRGIAAFRAAAVEGSAKSGLYHDSMLQSGPSTHLSSAGVGFGLLGLCFDAKLGRTTLEASALLLQQTVRPGAARP